MIARPEIADVWWSSIVRIYERKKKKQKQNAEGNFEQKNEQQSTKAVKYRMTSFLSVLLTWENKIKAQTRARQAKMNKTKNETQEKIIIVKHWIGELKW